jgi:ribosomal protein L7/L12
MTTVKLSGWREGLSKVQLNHLLRSHTGCGLGDAKHAVDQLLAGETLVYEFSEPGAALDFRRSAEAVGAVCTWAGDDLGGSPQPPASR